MLRLLTPIMAALVLCVAVPAPTRAAEDGGKLIGLWQEEMDGYKVVWCIGYWNGKWSVSAALHKPSEKKGAWLGADVRLADGKLTFTRKPGANAPATVMEDIKVTVQAVKDGELFYNTDKGGPRTLTRTTDVALAPDVLPSNGGAAVIAKNGKPNRGGDSTLTPGGKPPEDAKKYAGKWSGNGEIHGFKEVWTIQVNDDGVAVNGTFVDPKGKRPTCYVSGANVRFEGGKLVFNQQLGTNCPGYMGNNTKISVEAATDTLSYRYFGGGRNLTRLSRSAIEAGLIGTWTGEIDGLTEVVIVRRSGTRWQVGANMLRGNRPVSGWKGMDVKLADGKLTFTRKLRTVPAGWMDKSQCTLEWDGGNLSYNFVNGDTKGEPRKLKPLSK
ncbi:MAG TPA: hypothetical protein VMG10_09770 [Gemmataceae bacterium]|nr:hypothetical protein [Gemmataceae bacterium]